MGTVQVSPALPPENRLKRFLAKVEQALTRNGSFVATIVASLALAEILLRWSNNVTVRNVIDILTWSKSQ